MAATRAPNAGEFVLAELTHTFDYFHSETHDGFAAVPLHNTGQVLTFNADDLPLCDAGLSIPLVGTFVNRASLVQHRRGRYGCPLLHPEPTDQTYPINHARWPAGGCKLVIPPATGARIRHQLDRDGERYRQIYNQRTAVERIFSQAVALGIERPKLRNRHSVTHLNTLIYILINLRALQRVQDQRAAIR